MKLKVTYAALVGLVLLLALTAFAQTQKGTLKGKVKEINGKALSGVAIRAVNAADQKDVHETKSDSKGDFEISGLSEGDYVLTFVLAGFRTFVTRRLEVKAGDTIKLRSAVEMSRERTPQALIRGAVFNSDGFSLSNATVVIERVSDNKRLKLEEKMSGEDGVFAFRVPAEKATYRITATARGFKPDSKEVTVDSDEIQSVALSLERVK